MLPPPRHCATLREHADAWSRKCALNHHLCATAVDKPSEHAQSWAEVRHVTDGVLNHDRPALLDYAERSQDYDFTRGDRPAIQDFPREHRQGRTVQTRVPGGLT